MLFAATIGLGCDAGKPWTGPAPRAARAPAPVMPATDPHAPGRGPGSLPEGARLYALYCASCHGARGDGDGPVARGLDPRPARHSDGAYMNALSDEHLHRVIAEGGAAVGKSPLMAPWAGTLDDAQIRSVVAFLRSLAEPPYRPDGG